MKPHELDFMTREEAERRFAERGYGGMSLEEAVAVGDAMANPLRRVSGVAEIQRAASGHEPRGASSRPSRPIARHPSGRLGVLTSALAIGLLFVQGCASMRATDDAADVLKILGDSYKAAVVAHDAAAATEDPVTHAEHRRVLLATHDAIGAGWDSVIAWRKAQTAEPPVAVLTSVSSALRAFLPLAVQLGVLDGKTAKGILALLNAAYPQVSADRPLFPKKALGLCSAGGSPRPVEMGGGTREIRLFHPLGARFAPSVGVPFREAA